jgi:hypothetical protein
MTRTLSRLWRVQLVAALVAASALIPVLGSPAVAETASEPAAIGAYFWKDKLPSTIVVDPDGPAGPVPAQVQPNPVNGQDTDLDLVARDELAVAVTLPGESNKETYLAWDLTTVPLEATITGFTVTSPLSDLPPSDDTTQNSRTTEPSLANIKACAAVQGFGDTDAGAYENKPLFDEKRCVQAKFDAAKKAFTYDVGSFAAGFATADVSGVALVPSDNTSAFQVVFGRTTKHTASITYTMPSETEPPVDPAPVAPVPPVTPGGGVTVPGGGFAPSPPVIGGEPAPTAPTVQEPTPVVQPTQGAVPVASASVPARPPSGFWVLALVLAALLAAMSAVTGSPVAAGQVRRRQGAVLRQMQRRGPSGVGGLTRTARV